MITSSVKIILNQRDRHLTLRTEFLIIRFAAELSGIDLSFFIMYNDGEIISNNNAILIIIIGKIVRVIKTTNILIIIVL